MPVVSPRWRKHFERTDDVALYDIVVQFTTGFTAVADALIERADTPDRERLGADREAIRREAAAVPPGNRQAAILFVERWVPRSEELQRRLPQVADEHSGRALVTTNR